MIIEKVFKKGSNKVKKNKSPCVQNIFEILLKWSMLLLVKFIAGLVSLAILIIFFQNGIQ